MKNSTWHGSKLRKCCLGGRRVLGCEHEKLSSTRTEKMLQGLVGGLVDREGKERAG